MTAAALVADLRARGVTLEPHGGRLRVRPVSAVRPEDAEAIRQLKPEILRLLHAEATGTDRDGSGWPRAIAEHRRTSGAFEPCIACSIGTWVRYAAVPFCRRCADTRGTLALAYWDALTELDRLNAEGADADPETCRLIVDRPAQLTDDLGADLAIRLRARWTRTSGRCPLCGGPTH